MKCSVCCVPYTGEITKGFVYYLFSQPLETHKFCGGGFGLIYFLSFFLTFCSFPFNLLDLVVFELFEDIVQNVIDCCGKL